LTQICSPGQQSDALQNPTETPADHVLWIIPNFRTISLPQPYRPASVKEKFQIAAQDSFDRGTVGLAAVFAADGQATDSHRSFGHGAAGYAHYLATAYSDAAIGNVMTEAIFPSFLHEDPRFVTEFWAYGERPIDPVPALFRLLSLTLAMCHKWLKDVPRLGQPDDLKAWS
jgi:hypothetical protein